MLADATGEHEKIEAAESGRHASDGFADLVGEHAE
jgi:hypothetical protein